jgi:3-keto-L-gulonate-6-phosphate decarboxylase
MCRCITVLAGRCAVVDADVVTVGTELLIDVGLGAIEELEQRETFFLARVE